MARTAAYADTFALRLPLPETFTAHAWLGALSFEERCLGSLRALQGRPVRLSRPHILNYATTLEPADEGHDLRMRYLDEIHSICRTLSEHECQSVPVDAHAPVAILNILAHFKEPAPPASLILDISCMTKIHTIALAADLPHNLANVHTTIAYSVPENYGALAESRKDFPGFVRTIVAPLVPGASLFKESQARGIIVLGHESQRLLVAFSEIEPPGGVILRSVTRFRPDFEHVTIERNRSLLKDLRLSKRWDEVRREFTDFGGIVKVVATEANNAKKRNGPLLLYPFGPKSVIFAAAWAAGVSYPEGTWFIYPVRANYDAHYSEGVHRTYWLRTPQEDSLRDL